MRTLDSAHAVFGARILGDEIDATQPNNQIAKAARIADGKRMRIAKPATKP